MTISWDSIQYLHLSKIIIYKILALLQSAVRKGSSQGHFPVYCCS